MRPNSRTRSRRERALRIAIIILALLVGIGGTACFRNAAPDAVKASPAKAVRDAVSNDSVLREAVERHPEDVAARREYGRRLLNNGDYLGARTQFEEVTRLAPNRADGHLAMAELFESADMFDTAIAATRTAVRRDPDNPDAIAALGRLYLGMDWNIAALETLQGGVARFPDNIPLRVALTKTLFQISDFRAALKQADIVEQKAPENRELDARRVDILLQLQRNSEALAAAERGLSRTSGDPALSAAQARVLNSLSRFPDAESAARKVLALQPDYDPSHYELAIALEGQKRFADAAHVYEGIVQRNFRYGRAALRLAALYNRLGKSEAGAALARRFRDAEAGDAPSSRALLRVGNRPHDPDAHLEAGIRHQEGGRIPRAVVEFRETLRLRPGDANAARRLQQSLVAMQRTQEAQEIAASTTGNTARTDHQVSDSPFHGNERKLP